MTGRESFCNILAQDHSTRATAAKLAAHWIEEAQRAGVSITSDDLHDLPSYRLAVLTDNEAMPEDWIAEAEIQLPAFRKRAEERAAMAALANTEDPQHQAELDRVAAMKPEERMRFARETGAVNRKQDDSRTKRDLSPKDRAEAIREIARSGVRGAAKIGLARRLGLA